MNYYGEWWNKARQSSGILTKPVIRRKLEQENKLLQTENNQLKEQLAQTGQDYQEINEELIQVKEYNQAYQTKINALETQLLNLAKQKLKGKKEAERLLTELETKWNQDKEKLNLTLNKEIQKVKNLEKYLFRTRGDKETQTELSKTDIEQLQNTVDYYSQTFPNLEKELAKLREKEKDKDQEIRALKLDKGDLLKTVGEKESELLETESNNQNQLRQINLLFDPSAKDYETIDFNGLYSLLQQIAERERERDDNSETGKKWWWQK